MKFSQLYWQCRRGNLELDLLLQNYLKNNYPNADESKRKQFIELLKLDDRELFSAFLIFKNSQI